MQKDNIVDTDPVLRMFSEDKSRARKLASLAAREFGYKGKKIAFYLQKDPSVITRYMKEGENFKADMKCVLNMLCGKSNCNKQVPINRHAYLLFSSACLFMLYSVHDCRKRKVRIIIVRTIKYIGNTMNNLPTWEVKLSVDGSIKVYKTINFGVLKGFQLDQPFYSDIVLDNSNAGIDAYVTAFASTGELAHKAALIFFGQMLDALALNINQPLYLRLSEHELRRKANYTVRRLVEAREWKEAFYVANRLSEAEPTFLRALGWYRKGLYSEDSFDKFLAFWNSIEVTASKYHPQTPRAQNGSKSQIWECFKLLWGECENWPTVIRGEADWIDENYETRKKIAHGIASISIHDVEDVLVKLNKIKILSQEFLTEWMNKQIDMRDSLIKSSCQERDGKGMQG